MPWNCKMIEFTRETNMNTLEIGSMFYGPTWEEYKDDEALPSNEQKGLYWPFAVCKPTRLSDYYRDKNYTRKPLLVRLPGRILFCVDGKQWSDGKFFGGWKVTGEAPLITVEPSINCVGVYHGLLVNGVLSDDCEGRHYNLDGSIIRPKTP